ncbi:MAG TPA: hypothetical protein VKC61_12725 [Pyrinomonadaceae bacterium]|nr:hypothetical protein [Pyrinomonadaceae bacterium]
MPVPKLVKRVIPTGRCIYCSEVKEFSREHYLPECLGTFTNFETLDDRICEDCNGRIGRALEEQFCRGGEIAYFRHLLGIQGKKSHKGKVDYFLRGSGGASPLRMKGNIPGGEEEVHFQLVRSQEEGKLGIDYMAQMILTAESGETHHVLLENMKEPEELQAKVDALGIGKLKQVNVIATPDQKERVEHLAKCFPVLEKSKWEELPTTGTTYTTTSFEVTDKYFRAIAKIGFHYILKHFRSFRGDEDCFADIRRFILEGGDIAQFVRWTEKQFISHIEAGYVPAKFGHVILARANERIIWGKLQFFIGPGSTPSVYELAVAHNPTKLVYDITSAHSFCYYESGPRDGKLGVMDEMKWIETAPAQAGIRV